MLEPEYTYQELKADALNQVRGMEPGKYHGDGTILTITKAQDHYVVHLKLHFRSWTFIYPASEYERGISA